MPEQDRDVGDVDAAEQEFDGERVAEAMAVRALHSRDFEQPLERALPYRDRVLGLHRPVVEEIIRMRPDDAVERFEDFGRKW